MSGFGFGICGHKTSYSRGVLVGNYINQARDDDDDEYINKHTKKDSPIQYHYESPSDQIAFHSHDRQQQQHHQKVHPTVRKESSLSFRDLFHHDDNVTSQQDDTIINTKITKKNSRIKEKEEEEKEPEMMEALSQNNNNKKNEIPVALLPDFKRQKVQIQMRSGSVTSTPPF